MVFRVQNLVIHVPPTEVLEKYAPPGRCADTTWDCYASQIGCEKTVLERGPGGPPSLKGYLMEQLDKEPEPPQSFAAAKDLERHLTVALDGVRGIIGNLKGP